MDGGSTMTPCIFARDAEWLLHVTDDKAPTGESWSGLFCLGHRYPRYWSWPARMRSCLRPLQASTRIQAFTRMSMAKRS